MSNARFATGEAVYVRLSVDPDVNKVTMGTVLFIIQLSETTVSKGGKPTTKNVWFYDVQIKSGHILRHVHEHFMAPVPPVTILPWEQCIFMPEDIKRKKES